MLREFKRRLHQYISNQPDYEKTDEYLALMQDFGAPTRFLDFTYSPYVAAYFAFEYSESNTRVGIWGINTEWLKEALKKLNPNLSRLYECYAKE